MKITLIQGDCLKVLPNIPDESVDLIVTDPPYNANDIGPKHRRYESGTMKLPIEDYKKFCSDWFSLASKKARNIVFTSGISNVNFYPQPHWIICWHKPAAVSFNRMGGFNVWELILCYGTPAKGQRIQQDYVKFNTLNSRKGIEKNHPCSKVPDLIEWIIAKFSNEGDTILDAFLGSGTTMKACLELKRNCIGIETEPRYIDICKQRLNWGSSLSSSIEWEFKEML